MKHDPIRARVKAMLAFKKNNVRLKNGWCVKKRNFARPTLVLIGFMGSGKSTLGQSLAAATNSAFIDTDAMLEMREGKSISEIFSESGEAGFRRKEAALLCELLVTSFPYSRTSSNPAVIATGGGAVISRSARALLRQKNTLVIWLNTSYSAITKRLSGTTGRPLYERMKDSPAFSKLYHKRQSLYKSVADIVVYGNF